MAPPKPRKNRTLRLHPLLQGLVVGVFTGASVLTLVYLIDALTSGYDPRGGLPGLVVNTVLALFLFLQLVLYGFLTTFLCGAILYRFAPRIGRGIVLAILATTALTNLYGCGSSDVKFYPDPGANGDFALFSVAFIISALVFWTVALRAKASRRRPGPVEDVEPVDPRFAGGGE